MCDIPLYGHTRLQFDLFSAGVYIRGVGAVKTEQKGFEEALQRGEEGEGGWGRRGGQDPLRPSLLSLASSWSQPASAKKKKERKKLATGSTRLASINPGLFFINLIILLLKTFAKTVMMGSIREEGWDTGIQTLTVFRDGRSFQFQKGRPKRKCQKPVFYSLVSRGRQNWNSTGWAFAGVCFLMCITVVEFHRENVLLLGETLSCCETLGWFYGFEMPNLWNCSIVKTMCSIYYLISDEGIKHRHRYVYTKQIN